MSLAEAVRQSTTEPSCGMPAFYQGTSPLRRRKPGSSQSSLAERINRNDPGCARLLVPRVRYSPATVDDRAGLVRQRPV